MLASNVVARPEYSNRKRLRDLPIVPTVELVHSQPVPPSRLENFNKVWQKTTKSVVSGRSAKIGDLLKNTGVIVVSGENDSPGKRALASAELVHQVTMTLTNNVYLFFFKRGILGIITADCFTGGDLKGVTTCVHRGLMT